MRCNKCSLPVPDIDCHEIVIRGQTDKEKSVYLCGECYMQYQEFTKVKPPKEPTCINCCRKE